MPALSCHPCRARIGCLVRGPHHLPRINKGKLESQFEKLSNVEFIKENILKSLAVANDEQIGVLNNLKEIKTNYLKLVNRLTENYDEIGTNANGIEIQLTLF